MTTDDIKCEALGTELAAHPVVEAFRDIFSGLLRRQDVQVGYAQLAELDPGDGCWPFTDTVLVAGTISVDDLRETVSSLHDNWLQWHQSAPMTHGPCTQRY